VASRADQPFNIGFHQQLQHRLGDGAQEIAVLALLQQLDKRHSAIGHRVLGAVRGLRNSTLAHPPDDHLLSEPNFHHHRGRYLGGRD